MILISSLSSILAFLHLWPYVDLFRGRPIGRIWGLPLASWPNWSTYRSTSREINIPTLMCGVMVSEMIFLLRALSLKYFPLDSAPRVYM
mgnify:CR=1 FL=1